MGIRAAHPRTDRRATGPRARPLRTRLRPPPEQAATRGAPRRARPLFPDAGFLEGGAHGRARHLRAESIGDLVRFGGSAEHAQRANLDCVAFDSQSRIGILTRMLAGELERARGVARTRLRERLMEQ